MKNNVYLTDTRILFQSWIGPARIASNFPLGVCCKKGINFIFDLFNIEKALFS